MPTGTVIREMREAEYPLLEDFLYEAIFIPEDFDGEIPRSIIREPELAAFIEGFGTLPDDHCLVAEIEGTVVGARQWRGRSARARTPFSLFPPWEGEKLMGAEGRREGDTGPLSPGRPDRGNSRRLIIVIDM